MKHLLFFLFFLFGVGAFAQPSNDVVTPENAEAIKKAQHDKIEKEYLNRVKQHQDLQGKKEKKRMKRHLKKSQRQRRSGNLPWYKRMWIRRK
jgi:hypothetical protein